MKRHSKQQCKYAFAVTKYCAENDFHPHDEKDLERYNRFAAIEDKWRNGKASKAPVVNERWGLFS